MEKQKITNAEFHSFIVNKHKCVLLSLDTSLTFQLRFIKKPSASETCLQI